jgi:phosphoglycolate phosphatase
MTRITAAVFDKDGTLFDFQASWGAFALSFIDQLARGDAVQRAVLADVIGFDLDTGRFLPHSVAIAGTSEDLADAVVPYLTDGPSRSALIAHLTTAALDVEMQPAVPLAPYLDGLAQRGLALGLVTNDSERGARVHLEHSGILAAFGFVAGYDSGHGAKPSPGPLLAALSAFGTAPDRAVMVGDSTHDLIAGRAAGMWTVGVLTGIAATDELAPYADAVLPDIGHLPGWLDAR